MPASALMNVMVQAARKAGRSLARDFGEVEHLQVSIKGPANFVSAADHKAEQIIFDELSRARPGYGFLMEERGAIEGADKTHRWIVDPLDGTTNFLHSVPMFAISIGLEREGDLVAGVDLQSDEQRACSPPSAARAPICNDRRIRVAARTRMDESIVVTGIPHRGRPDHQRIPSELQAVMLETAGVRRTGAAALDLAWVAAGRFDGYWERAIKPWDMAAGIVLVREAGGFVTDCPGGQDMLSSGDVVAGNETVHRGLLKLVS